MNNINFLQKQLKKVKQIQENQRVRFSNEPNNFAVKVAIASTERRIQELEQKLMLAVKENHNELLELRLIGEPVNNGNITLDTLSLLTGYLSKAMHFAAYKIKNPRNKLQKVSNDLELRFEGLAYGSCKLYVSGSAKNDLVLFDETLSSLFKLLNHDLTLPLTEAVNKIGRKSVHNLGLFLRELSKSNISVDFRLLSNENKYLWYADKDRILKLEKILDAANYNIEEIELQGKISLISINGKIGIQVLDHKRPIEMSFAKEFLDHIKTFTIDSLIKVKIEKKTTFHEYTSEESMSYKLLTILD